MVANETKYPIQTLKSEQKRLILCPGAEFGPAKQWPAHSYAKVANSLISQGWQVLVLGSEADKVIASEIENKIILDDDSLFVNLCGLTQLHDAIDLLDTADAVVSNDSGLMNIAAALHKPLVAIYGPTSPDFTPPLSDNSHIVQIKVDCGPCFQRTCPEQHHDCMRDISSDDMLKFVRSSQPVN